MKNRSFFTLNRLRVLLLIVSVCAGTFCGETQLRAQAVMLPAPRLLTTFPMGAQVGKSVEVTVTGDFLEEVESLHFSSPKIKAVSVVDSSGNTVTNRFTVTVAADCPAGIYEAWVMTRLGVSSCRAFTIGTKPEVNQKKPNNTVETAMPLEVNTVCNSVLTNRAIDFYSFHAEKGQRIVVDCAARGIDSKLQPVIILADATGADLQVERRGGVIDFHVPETATYIVKVHDLTYKGGTPYFYRLAIQLVGEKEAVPRFASVKNVNMFSWPPVGLPATASLTEVEPNDDSKHVQKISLPADISGKFYPAADVDLFQFEAKKGEVWWVEVASQRLGLNTDPAVIVQQVEMKDGQEVLTDVVELNDIKSPVKVSSNGYSYDGPVYNAGSTDVLGKIEIKKDGTYRLQLLDLFGGTRSNPENRYRLVIRKAAPDFAVVGWALHMNLRNGDRNALSKPLALRGGTTMPIEVVVIRRDGFDGEIELSMKNLPAGVSATGVKIPARKSRGILLVTANSDAPRGTSNAELFGTAIIDGKQVTRTCYLASMKWPVPNAAAEIPAPRLVSAVPVSVCGSELAPLTIAPAEEKIWEARVGEKLTIPLTITSRCEHTGSNITLSTFCAGLGNVPAFSLPLKEKSGKAVLDLKALKTPAGEYKIAFYGKAVAKYRHNVNAIAKAEEELEKAKQQVTALETEIASLAELAKTVTAKDEKKKVEENTKQAKASLEQAVAKVKAAEKKLTAATNAAKPKDIVDIVVAKPCTIRVLPAEKKP